MSLPAQGATSSSASAPRPREGLHIPSLDGIRAVAVLIVFFSHVGLERFVAGGFGVTIFFFLSGFLITTLLRLEGEHSGRVSMRNFYLRRGLRILPLMYIVLGTATICTIALGASLSKSVLALQAVHLTNYQTVKYAVTNGAGFPIGTIVLWSLAVEEHFYLLFPIAYVTLRRRLRQPQHQAAVLLGACGVLLVWRCILVFGFGVTPEYMMHATDTRIDSILFGCALALWKNPVLKGPHLSPRATWRLFAVSMIVLVLTVAARNPAFRETFRYTIQGIALAPVFVAAIRFPRALPFRLLNTPVVSFIGVVSYGLYLVHLPIILTLQSLTTWPAPIVAAVSLCTAFLVSTLLYHVVERPCARLRRRLSYIPTVGATSLTTPAQGFSESVAANA